MKEVLNKLDEKAKKLEEDLKKINGWIKHHLDTEPNFYEIASSWIRFGELVHEKCLYYNQVGYPYNFSEKRPYTRYEIVGVDASLRLCYNQMNEMEHLRRIAVHPLFDDENIKELYEQEIICASLTGYMSYSKEMKELFCKCLSVPFYIYQEQRKDCNYKYDNKEEFVAMKTTLEESLFSDSDRKRAFISSILNKIYQNSIWYDEEKGDLYQIQIQKQNIGMKQIVKKRDKES